MKLAFILALTLAGDPEVPADPPVFKEAPQESPQESPQEAPDESPEQAETPKAKKKRFKFCGCARPRLLRKGKEVLLDENNSVAAWIRAGRVELGAFERIKEGETFRTQSVPAPLGIRGFDLTPFGEPVASSHQLQRAYATGPYEGGFLLGLLRTKNQQPADVVRARATSAFAPSEGAPPAVKRLWLSPFTHRVHPSCGESDTYRLHYDLVEGAPPIAGFVVVTGGKAALLDERHTRQFGIGRVEPCDQGLELQNAKRAIEVYPVGWDLSVGEPFRFSVSPIAGAHPVLVAAPDGVDRDLEKNPFVNPPPDPLEELLSDEKDTVALGAMLFVMFGAIGVAGVGWRAWRRRRREETVECPVCEAELTLNLMDSATDGMFCPKCGKSSVFVTFEPDGTPRARVYKLD